MKKRRQLFTFLILNVVVSAVTMWVVLSIWFQPTGSDAPGGIVLGGGQSSTVEDGAQNTPAAGQAAGQLEITRIVGAGDLASERVEIRHVGESEISLEGWRLRDEDGNEYLFPNLTMVGQGAVTLFTKVGTDTVVELYWGLEETVWESGEVATLVDPDGNPQATYVVP